MNVDVCASESCPLKYSPKSNWFKFDSVVFVLLQARTQASETTKRNEIEDNESDCNGTSIGDGGVDGTINIQIMSKKSPIEIERE